MNDLGSWSTEDFDRMSWHDVHVHGFRIVENDGETGTAELFLDLDYILEWRQLEEGFEFVVAQATLQFHQVFGLKLLLDYLTPTAGMSAFSLAGIQREQVRLATGHTSYKWRLEINWPQGFMEFEAPGFTQLLIGNWYVQPSQCLAAAQRSVGGAP